MLKLFENFISLKDLIFITWSNHVPNFDADSIYVLQKITDDYVIFYKDYKYSDIKKGINGTIVNCFRILTDDELENYIYNNKREFSVFMDKYGSVVERYIYSRFIKLFISEEEREKIRLKYIDIDPYNEEDWFED